MAGEQSSWYLSEVRVAVQKSSVAVSKGIRWPFMLGLEREGKIPMSMSYHHCTAGI